MEEGFLPDYSHAGPIEALWHRGRPEQVLFFGFVTAGTKIDKTKLLTITAFRCTKCGLLKSYAREQDDKPK